MCEYIDMLEAKGQERGERIGEERGRKIGQEWGEKIGEERSKKIGEEQGENKLASLLDKLHTLKREEDARLAVQDKNIRMKLYEEFGIVY